MTRLSTPAANFDKLAHIYRWMEYCSFGPYLARCRFHFLSELGGCRNGLILGDGRFTSRLLRSYAHIWVRVLDASPAMLRVLTHAVEPFEDRLVTQCVDIRSWQPAHGAEYDLIATHFFLDCLSTGEIEDLAASINGHASSNALWLVSEFSIPKGILGRFVAVPLVGVLYRGFRLLTGLRQQALPDYKAALAKSGWVLQREHAYLGGLLVSQLWQRA